jgi:hypothetical protein
VYDPEFGFVGYEQANKQHGTAKVEETPSDELFDLFRY